MDNPPFKFRVLKTYKDALSRQLGEALKIWMTGDDLLNSKNEYLSNCITRITVQEGAVERKLRERNEEIAEKEETERVKTFKEQKENCWTGKMEGEFYKQSTLVTKRKDEEIFTESVPAKRRKTVPASCIENGKMKLQELRVRMERERNWVIEVMDRKRLDDILVD